MAACFFYRQSHAWLTHRESVGVCQRELLESQQKVGESLHRLMKLNPAVRAAKVARTLALAAMALPMTAEAGAVAYQEAMNTLRLLKASQEALLLKARVDLFQGLAQARKEVSLSLEHADQAKSALQTAAMSDLRSSPLHLAVRPRDETDQYPEYVLEDSFSSRQRAQVSWKVGFRPVKEVRTWSENKWNFSKSCAATLVTSGSDEIPDFTPRLSEDKSTSKSSSFF